MRTISMEGGYLAGRLHRSQGRCFDAATDIPSISSGLISEWTGLGRRGAALNFLTYKHGRSLPNSMDLLVLKHEAGSYVNVLVRRPGKPATLKATRVSVYLMELFFIYRGTVALHEFMGVVPKNPCHYTLPPVEPKISVTQLHLTKKKQKKKRKRKRKRKSKL